MRIETNIPVLTNPKKIITKISKFWNKTSYGWKEIWGPHIHHGFYDTLDDSSIVAQEKLIDKLVQMLDIKPGNKILDVGCGMGGSSIILAKKYQAHVMGITLSTEQIDIAQKLLPIEISDNIKFKIEDAHNFSGLQDNTFDIVWSLESCEQFYNKELFMKQAFRVLKPNGKLMIATWCSDREYYEGDLAKRYLSICKGFDLPYMPTLHEYSKLLLGQNFTVVTEEDWSQYVKQSWDIGIEMLRKYSWFSLLKLGGLMGFGFISKLHCMSQAFKAGQLRYGVFFYKKNA